MEKEELFGVVFLVVLCGCFVYYFIDAWYNSTYDAWLNIFVNTNMVQIEPSEVNLCFSDLPTTITANITITNPSDHRQIFYLKFDSCSLMSAKILPDGATYITKNLYGISVPGNSSKKIPVHIVIQNVTQKYGDIGCVLKVELQHPAYRVLYKSAYLTFKFFSTRPDQKQTGC